jgi:hypothetical protein
MQRDLLAKQEKKWKVEDVPLPPDELLEVLERSREQGFNFEPFYFPERDLIPVVEDSGGQSVDISRLIPAQDLLIVKWRRQVVINELHKWQLSEDGTPILGEKLHLSGRWVLIEGIQRPGFGDGWPMYPNDPLADYLAELRKHKKIPALIWGKTIPTGSRFGLSQTEIKRLIAPEIARRLGVNFSRIGIPSAIEFNALGNLLHPEWGNIIDTWEHLADRCGVIFNLVGGCRDSENLEADSKTVLRNFEVRGDYSRDDNIGFRTIINFPQRRPI